MTDKAWKATERAIARLVRGKRRGADYGDRRGGKTDVVHSFFALEVKHSKYHKSFAFGVRALKQAERARKTSEGQIPLAVVHRENTSHMTDICYMYFANYALLVTGKSLVDLVGDQEALKSMYDAGVVAFPLSELLKFIEGAEYG